MLITKSTFNIFYTHNTKIHRKIFDFEDRLSEYFGTPFHLVPIPEDAPPEIPRIEAVSKNGHSNLKITQQHMSFITNYNDAFNRAWPRCFSYIQERAEKLIPVLSNIVDNFLFSGLTVEIILDEYNNPIEIIKDKFLNERIHPNPFDCNLKLTFINEETNYVNITLSNARIFTGEKPPDLTSQAFLKNTHETLGMVVDVNDRYAFNFGNNYISHSKNIIKNIEIVNLIIESKLKEIIETGGVSL